MDPSPSPRLRPRETTPKIDVVAPRHCECVGCRSCELAGRKVCLQPLLYAGRGRPPHYCEECRFGGAAKAER